MEICKVYSTEIGKGDKLVIFTKNGCPYCEQAKEKLMKLSIPDSMIDNLPQEIIEISVDECNDVIDKYDIKVTPTFVRLVDGKEVGRVVGFEEDGMVWLLTMDTGYEADKEESDEGYFIDDEQPEHMEEL